MLRTASAQNKSMCWLMYCAQVITFFLNKILHVFFFTCCIVSISSFYMNYRSGKCIPPVSWFLRNMESTFLHLCSSVKMDASQWREEPCSFPIALHCCKLITTLPSKITPTPTCPTLTTHPSLNLPPPQPQPQILPQPAWQTGPVNSPCKQGKKAEQRGKMTGPQMTGVVKIVRRRKAWGQRARAAL